MDALSIFRLIAPEFDYLTDEDIKKYMFLYSDQLSEKRFGKTYNKALAYFTAHKMKMSGLGEVSGLGSIADSLRIGSVSEGETSVSFTTNQSTNLQADGEFALTTYGLEYLSLRRNCIISILSAGEAY